MAPVGLRCGQQPEQLPAVQTPAVRIETWHFGFSLRELFPDLGQALRVNPLFAVDAEGPGIPIAKRWTFF